LARQRFRGVLGELASCTKAIGCYGRLVTLPRWLLRFGWAVHKALARLSGGRIGTIRAAPTRLGTLFLLTSGRKTGRIRRNGLYYFPEGDGFVVVASNAGADQDPAWWRNLQANPDAAVELGGRLYPVRAREVLGDEHDRLYARFEGAARQYEVYRESAPRAIPVIVLEPRAEASARPDGGGT
jgi:deazaflavin-dependent oxidoreductase (nitroreductase family)